MKRLRIQLPRQQIGRQMGMASVPVRKRMDEDQAVMKPDRDFVGCVGSVRNLVAGIAAEGAQFDRNPIGVDADVAGCCPELPGPLPDITKHPPVQLLQERSFENDPAPAEGPAFGVGDADLLGLVELGAQCDVGRDQPFPLLGSERGIGVIILVEKRVAHSGRQIRRGSSSRAAIKRSRSLS